MTESGGHPIQYYDQESRQKKDILYLQQPAAEYRFKPIDTLRKTYFNDPDASQYLGDRYMLEYFCLDGKKQKLRVNYDILVRIVPIPARDSFFSAPAAATATTATTKVKRPSFSGKKATAKAAKQSSSSSSISKAASGKENKLPAKPQSKSSEFDMIDLCKDETDSGGVVEIMDSSDDDA